MPDCDSKAWIIPTGEPTEVTEGVVTPPTFSVATQLELDSAGTSWSAVCSSGTAAYSLSTTSSWITLTGSTLSFDPDAFTSVTATAAHSYTITYTSTPTALASRDIPFTRTINLVPDCFAKSWKVIMNPTTEIIDGATNSWTVDN